MSGGSVGVRLDQEEFLNRIRNSLQHTLLPAASPEHPGSFEGYTFPADAPVDKLVEDFRRELEALSGHVYTPADSGAAIDTVLEILRRHEADRIIAWDETYLAAPGIEAALGQAGISIEDSFIPAGGAEREARLARLDGVMVGLTGAEAGLADTGTVVLLNGPGRGRLASLLPPVHIALLPVQKLYPSLPTYLAANPQATTAGSNLVFIAGPSRSGDIELALSIGVHGPGEVHVILVGSNNS
jgi:L-lactate dehydrogenase complex protein LldG